MQSSVKPIGKPLTNHLHLSRVPRLHQPATATRTDSEWAGAVSLCPTRTVWRGPERQLVDSKSMHSLLLVHSVWNIIPNVMWTLNKILTFNNRIEACLLTTSYSYSETTLFTLCHSHQTIIITQSHSPLLLTCFTSSLELASYITQDSSSKLFIPLSATIIWTCRFNLLHTAITYRHSITLSLWAQNLPFQKILSSTLVCFCLSDWSHGSRLFTGLICSLDLCFSSIFLF